MAASITLDFSDVKRGVDGLQKMGLVRHSEIMKAFRVATKPLVKSAKSKAGRSKKGVSSKMSKGRTHTAGNLRRSIKFIPSRKYENTAYVFTAAYYRFMYVGGHGSFSGNQFMQAAISSTETEVKNILDQEIGKLIGRSWNG